jgi:UPF0716 family protein affecting phage T7 exclusion
MELITFVIGIGLLVVFVLIMRAIGAWMLRINEVIEEQQKTNAWLKRLNENFVDANRKNLDNSSPDPE